MPNGANENDSIDPQLPAPDPHGQAALMLSESILHALVSKSTVTIHEAFDIVQTAQEVKIEVATLAGEDKSRMLKSLELLNRIAISLSTDIR